MKTEQEFSDFFTESSVQSGVDPQLAAELSKKYWIDLTSHLNRYFSAADRDSITRLAAQKFAEQLKNEEPETAWKNVVRSFISENNWNFKFSDKKPEVKKTEEQVIFWNLFKYGWALFQSMVILKIAVMYFGLQSALHPETNPFWLLFFIGLAAGSLFFFAYRNRNDNG